MKIREVHIDGFGTWRDLSLGDFSDGVTVIYGPNEAGKTTLMQFMRTVLYGFNPYRRQRYLPPVKGGRPGGSLSLIEKDVPFRVVRHGHVDDAPGQLGEVTVVAPDGVNFGQPQLEALLTGVDEATFSNVFALGLKEIQELGSLDDTTAADHLYRLTGGLDRVSLVDVVRELQSSRQRLFGTHEKPAQVTALIARRDKLRDELRELSTRTERWLKLAALRGELQHEAEQLEGNIATAEDRVRIMEVAIQARELWNHRREIDAKLAKVGQPKRILKKFVVLLKKYNERSAKSLARLNEIKGLRGKILADAKAVKINQSIWAQAARIEALTEHAGWVETLENQIERLKAELKGHETALQTQTATAGTPGFDVSLANQQTLQALRKPMRLIGEEEERLESAKRNAIESRAEYDALVQKIEQRLTERNETDLQVALQNASERIQLLRRRIQIEQRSDQMLRHRDELENYRDDLFERHVMPMWISVGLGVMFATGIMLILFTFISPLFPYLTQQLDDSTQQMPLLFIGLVLTLVSAGLKVGLERQTTLKLDTVRRQLLQLNRQMSDLQQQREQIDESLPHLTGSLDVRLTRAEEDLRRLEEILPMQTQRDALKLKADTATRAEQESETAVKEARARWKAALRAQGLPETFSFSNAKQFSQKGEELTQTRRQLDVVKDELQQRERELLSLATRIDQLMGDIRLKPTSERPQDRLAQLAKALEEQRDLDFLRSDLKRQVREFRKEYDQARKLVKRDQRSRESIFTKLGVRNEKEFTKAVERWRQFRVLTKRRDLASQKIITMLAGRISEEHLDAELLPPAETTTGNNAPSVEARREESLTRIREHRIRLGQVHEKRGQAQQEMVTLADDRRLDELKVELACLERQIAQQVRQWQVFAATEYTLTSVRKIYETHRQPETLREASEYLKQLTAGNYTRLWTPLEDRTLRVDDSEGKPVRLEVLSRGTREAIFLSLRLALVNSFAKRGARLPLVLDDVLVNFDTGRVKAAATVLRDFAKEHGHQIIFFTCHEHIMKIFRSVKVDVRTLPGHEVASEPEPERPRKKRPEPEPIAVPEPEPVLLTPPPTPEPLPPPEPVVVKLVAPPPPLILPTPPKQPAELVENIPDFHEFAYRFANDNRTYTDLWSAQYNDVYGQNEIVLDKPRPVVVPPPAPVRPTRVEPLPPVNTTAVLERPLQQRRQRFTWESPERYVEEDEEVV